MTQTMLEKMTRAIYAELDRQAEEGTQYVGSYGRAYEGQTALDGPFDLEAVARAALQALREPTGAMLKAPLFTIRPDGISGVERPVFEEDCSARTQIFRAMIDAILQEKPE